MNGRAAKANKTEWAALFLASAELVRQDYIVSFTMGNRTPMADLMVGHPPSGKQFWVDVKGIAGRGGGWFMRLKEELPSLFYILVSVGSERDSDKFFILSQDEANSVLREYRAAHPDWHGRGEGFSWRDAEPFADRWKILPR